MAARGNDPDSRPISVAELMARARQDGDEATGSPESPAPREGRGRRRGGPGSVSVSELTGDIPRVTAPIADDRPTSGDQPNTQERPTARDDDHDTNVIDRVREHEAHDAADQTSVLDPVGGLDKGHGSDDAAAANDDHADQQASAAEAAPAKRGGLLSRLRRKGGKDKRAADDSDRPADDLDTDHPDTDRAPASDRASAIDQDESDHPRNEPGDLNAAPSRPRVGSLGAPDLTGTDSDASETRALAADEASETRALAADKVAETPASDRAWSAVSPASREFHRVERIDADETTDHPDGVPRDDPRDDRRVEGGDETDGESGSFRADDHDADRTPKKQSPALQWLSLIGQVIAGLLIGAGLFWGFTQLWKWNEYFALVLAVVVIFGLVTLVHVVRRSQDLLSTLLALGVGLIVTIGPLVLLGTGS